MELETQKAVGSIPAPSSGIVTKIHVKQGMEVSGRPSADRSRIERRRERRSRSQRRRRPATEAPPAKPSAPPPQTQPATTAVAVENYHYESKSGAPPPAPPAMRKIARELGIDLTRVKGSEAGGRINLGDVRDYIQRLQQIAFHGHGPASGAARRPPAPTPTPSEAIDFAKWGPMRREKMSPLRRTVSRRMVESWTTIPKINQFADADITALLALRKKHAPAYEKKGAHLTLTSFLLLVLGARFEKASARKCQHG